MIVDAINAKYQAGLDHLRKKKEADKERLRKNRWQLFLTSETLKGWDNWAGIKFKQNPKFEAKPFYEALAKRFFIREDEIQIPEQPTDYLVSLLPKGEVGNEFWEPFFPKGVRSWMQFVSLMSILHGNTEFSKDDLPAVENCLNVVRAWNQMLAAKSLPIVFVFPVDIHPAESRPLSFAIVRTEYSQTQDYFDKMDIQGNLKIVPIFLNLEGEWEVSFAYPVSNRIAQSTTLLGLMGRYTALLDKETMQKARVEAARQSSDIRVYDSNSV